MSSAERWQHVSRIYSGALAREGSARADFLREMCAGDDSLQRDVESLLAGVPLEREMLEQQVPPVATEGTSDAERSMADRAAPRRV